MNASAASFVDNSTHNLLKRYAEARGISVFDGNVPETEAIAAQNSNSGRPGEKSSQQQKQDSAPVTLLGNSSIGKNCKFEENVIIHPGVVMNNSIIGRYTYISSLSRIVNTKIGRFCSIGTDIMSGLGRHPSTGFISTYPAFYSAWNSGCRQSFVKQQLFQELLPVI